MADPNEKNTIHWDGSKANTVNADFCTASSSRAEISLLFGTAESEDRIRLTNRIILNPLTAKQFAAALQQILSDYESKYGPLRQTAPKPTDKQRRQKASSLFELVKSLDISMGYEQSFKMLDEAMLANRFLLGISKKEIAFKANDRIAALCERMNMPHSLMEVFRQCLLDVNYLHFGFEQDRDSCLYKVYVEFWDSIKEEIKKTGNYSKPYILHIGFKWDPFDPERKALTRYTWYPHLTGEKIIARLSAIAEPGRHPHVFETARELIDIALQRMPYHDIRYLEVSEQGNPRKSFDINVYRGGILVEEVYKLLAHLGRHYRISSSEFHQLYNSIRENRFGHLSGGLNREGKDFCTVYHGVESIHGASRQVLPRGEGSRHVGPRISDRPVEETDEQAGLLRDMVKQLDMPFGFERSFKMAQQTFLPGRFLMGLQNSTDESGMRGRILDVCRSIGMPADFLSSFEQQLPDANIVLFGFEKNEATRFHKAYLEFTHRLQKAVESNPAAPDPFLMFIGFKWDIADPSRKIVTNYTCYPSFLLRDMRQKASGMFSREKGREPDMIMEGILDLASHRAGPEDFLYFEADEPSSERKSFDINLYKAGLKMTEIYPLLLDMARHFSVPVQDLHGVYETAKPQVLGHIAGGTDRRGRDFLTFYFSQKASMRGRPPDPTFR